MISGVSKEEWQELNPIKKAYQTALDIMENSNDDRDRLNAAKVVTHILEKHPDWIYCD